jgi:hypothetical protein
LRVKGIPVTSEQEQAAWLTGVLWQAVWLAGGPATRTVRHFPAAFDPAFTSSLPLPSGDALPPGQPVAMLDHTGHGFERYTDPAALRAACQNRPRARVHKDIGWRDDGSWAALAGRHLTRLSDGPRVTVTVYESASGDESSGVHRDAWLGLIVQVTGAKHWSAGEGLTRAAPDDYVRQVTMRAGDVLIVPKNLPHRVTTPVDPGHSVHLVFAVGRDLIT